jgi:ABC-2 type transport system permease protein
MISIAAAFIRRDFLIWASYRLAFLWQILGVIGMVGVVYFVGQYVGEGLTEPVQGLSVDYFDYLITGIAFTDVLTLGLGALPGTVSEGQKSGTLEAMLLAHFRLFAIIIYSSAFGLLLSLVRLTIYAGMAVFVFGLWHKANMLSVMVIFLLSSIVFTCLGVLSASFTLVLKRGDPVVGIYGLLSALLGGVLFPVSILPAWIQPLSQFVPLFHALNGIRFALGGATLAELQVEVMSLLIMVIIFFPLSIVIFRWAINRAKMEGSLVQY